MAERGEAPGPEAEGKQQSSPGGLNVAEASPQALVARFKKRAVMLVFLMVAVLLYGTVGYRWLSDGAVSWLDAFYMTAITITTIGYGEIVPDAAEPHVRLFTLTLIFLGVGTFGYALSGLTYFITDPELHTYWRRRRMEKELGSWADHYVIGGWSPIASLIAAELRATERRAVVVANRPEAGITSKEADLVVVDGDPTDETALRRAGIERATGFFAAADDDATNIVACLTARQLCPDLRVVASVRDPRQTDKMRRAGADAVVSATAIGALRMASEMVRPTVVSFLDTMLRRDHPALRVEEVRASARRAGEPLGRLMEEAGADALLLALRRQDQWIFNPRRDGPLQAGDILVVMVTPEARDRLTKRLA